MPTTPLKSRTLDARPDRVDLRDRRYQPLLQSLPPSFPEPQQVEQHLASYVTANRILDQGREGACTGFGLAAVINYLTWRQAVGSGLSIPETVSPRMLYHLARFYDEWPGEDYEGSSCRGAMKGWHRHGVCEENLWPYRDKGGRVRFIKPYKGWDEDAALRPLGAYYRIDKNSITDMQAAILEVGAIYVSSDVHNGWDASRWKKDPDFHIALIEPPSDRERGGHAFAIVGYTRHGFIVQNSWGTSWGTNGFAILSYSDWVENGTDAWVAVLGAPMVGAKSPHYQAPKALTRKSAEPAQFFGFLKKSDTSFQYRNSAVKPWSEDEAYRHSVVLGNNGLLLNRSIQFEGALDAFKDLMLDKPLEWLQNKNHKKLVFYAHGGLNKEEASIKRVKILGPYFEANGLYPIFFTWKTGFLESLLGIIKDDIEGTMPQEAWGDAFKTLKQAVKEAKDRAIEAICQEVLVKAIWAQMKQNAEAAAYFPKSTLGLTTSYLAQIRENHPETEIHFTGHSAGSILFGYFLDLLRKQNLPIESCTLFAPACSLEFALEHYQPAIEKKILKKPQFNLEILTDPQEQADSVGPYGKSLLYLVSRALEDFHKTPLLGMSEAWNPKTTASPTIWNERCRKHVAEWQKFWGSAPGPELLGKRQKEVWDGQGAIPLSHGSFDNDVQVITRTLSRIAGVKKLRYPVETLRGF
ncbi:C1 family peptidase [Candidatus Nitronereus thalassa]|uniref:C1 family peptidase n=1 Tax=Candidatus Nitronereus thalassa TaxID=3020898 RepID=A0ABU3KB88_9BACT|nr:C1 family peptidase [Candidatus Nitronereus thalassa]MDT7043573.1 C1 family peptidase [Candidatus Nitronereus thalassa]